MNWRIVLQGVSAILGICLIVRLLAFNLHKVYRVFCVFLGYDLLSSLVAVVEGLLHRSVLGSHLRGPLFDYRLAWTLMRPIAWVLSLWMVYSLLGASLERLAGVLRYSRRLLNVVFFLAAIVALVIARPTDLFSGVASYTAELDKAIVVGWVFERVISMVAVLVLAAILSFIVWFPVRMPRNLTIFSFGYVFYFAIKTGLLLSQSYWSHEVSRPIGDLLIAILPCCFAYWIAFLTPEGETKTVQVGHSWNVQEQPRYIGQLEAINAALLRSARR